jgi:hypothetical protein
MSTLTINDVEYELVDQTGRNNTAALQKELGIERERITNLVGLSGGNTEGNAELQDIRVGFDGTVYGTAGEAVRALGTLANSIPQFRRISDSGPYSRLTVNLVEDGIYNITAASWDDIPCGNCSMQVLRYAVNYVIQIATDLNTGETYTRIVNRNDNTIYRTWVRDGSNTPQYRAITDSSQYGRLTVNVTEEGFYNIITSQWDDFPLPTGAVMLVFRYSPNYVVQIAISQVDGTIVTRVVHRTTHDIYRDWRSPEGIALKNILAIGDSICRGVRNNERGFVGDLGHPYKNLGKSGATISNKRTDVVTIPDQLVALSDFAPDIIIADGGVNDYMRGAALGDIPTVPVTTTVAADALDRDTVLGALQYLFYKMVTMYPKAQRFFLLTHKTTATLNGSVCDWTVTKNTAGYTQTELFNAIVKVCEVYGVQVIDVFNNGIINTAWNVYKSNIDYNTDNSVTNTEYVDVDGIHPLAYGYLHGYIPVIKKALGII